MRFLSLCLLWSIPLFLPAQPAVEVYYYSPREAAGGGYTQQVTPYRLLCNARRSLFEKGHSTDQLEFDEDGRQLFLHFSTGANWLFKDNRRRRLLHHLTSMREEPFLVRDELHPISWEILKETRFIGHMKVRKARGSFRGRHYTAWFAPSIPISNGPWKLGGLPGLILEAYDDAKLVVFLFRGIRQHPEATVDMPDHQARNITWRAFQSLFQEEVKQHFDFLNARLRRDGSDITYHTGAFEWWEYPE